MTKQTNKVSLIPGFATPAGNVMKPIYKRVYDEESKRFVAKKVRDINIYELIQSNTSVSDMAVLLNQYKTTGEIPNVDPSLIHGADTSIMPKNIHELYGTINRLGDAFNELPDSIKKVFGTSDKYIEHVVKGDVYTTILNYREPVVTTGEGGSNE